MRLSELVAFLDDELRVGEIPDYPGAVNGLQLGNCGEVRKVAAAVDASLPVIAKAAAAGASLLLVHHGMFWQGAKPLTGARLEKLRVALTAELAVYSAHLPLDVHPRFGNNALLAAALGLRDAVPFLGWQGIHLGLRGSTKVPRDEFTALVAAAVGGPAHLCPGGPGVVREVGVVTGGAGSEVEAAAAAGIDTFVTGEGPHWSYPLAEELGVNVVYAGHYATETFGVRALAEELARRFSLESCFIDHPTGL